MHGEVVAVDRTDVGGHAPVAGTVTVGSVILGQRHRNVILFAWSEAEVFVCQYGVDLVFKYLEPALKRRAAVQVSVARHHHRAVSFVSAIAVDAFHHGSVSLAYPVIHRSFVPHLKDVQQSQQAFMLYAHLQLYAAAATVAGADGTVLRRLNPCVARVDAYVVDGVVRAHCSVAVIVNAHKELVIFFNVSTLLEGDA